MPKALNETRDRLIAQGLKAMLVNGYDGIGLNEILQSAGVPKGSFYYFFKSKEAFATALLDAYEQHYVELRSSTLNDMSVGPLQRLRNYFDQVERIHLSERPLGGCFYGVLGQTVLTRTTAFRAKLADMFAHLESQLQGVLKQAQLAGEVDPEVDPKEAAAFLIDAYEGLMIRMKVDGNKKAFRRFRRFAIESLATVRA